MSLPPEVLALLGDDATPEDAIKAANRGTATYVDNLKQPDGDDNDARFAWYGMLAAAAIRAMEAEHAHFVAVGRKARRDTNRLYGKARVAYDALRNWRKP